MAVEQLQKVGGGVARERVADKTRLFRQIKRRGIAPVDQAVGEIAAAAARNADFFADFDGMVDQSRPQSQPAGLGGAHHAGRAGADDHGIVFLL